MKIKMSDILNFVFIEIIYFGLMLLSINFDKINVILQVANCVAISYINTGNQIARHYKVMFTPATLHGTNGSPRFVLTRQLFCFAFIDLTYADTPPASAKLYLIV